MKKNIFSAEEPSLGYLYQITYSLLLLLRSAENNNSKIGVEKLDDIQIDNLDYTDLYQTKYHLNSVANLTDRSTDLWKTIRVWSEGIKDGTIDLDATTFHLITTATAPENSIPAEFKKDLGERKIPDIVQKLGTIASEVSNQENQHGYKAFNNLSSDQRMKLISKIYLSDASIDISAVKKKIFSELRKTVIDDRVPRLYEMLVGWYLTQVITNLTGHNEYITFKELQQKNFEFIDTLKIDNLPADFPDPIEFADSELQKFKKRKFVEQLHLIGIGERSIKSAISDFHRAFEQRSKWTRECLINPADEINYERKLYDDWKRKFDLISDDIDSTDTNRIKLGRDFYVDFYINNHPKIFIKERFEYSYMVTGSCQILSDRKKIGWHPDYETKV